jgi:hypothetical protein
MSSKDDVDLKDDIMMRPPAQRTYRVNNQGAPRMAIGRP